MVFKTGKIDIARIFTELQSIPFTAKISEISRYFLGIPYKKNSLLGSASEKEQLVVDFEGVDCMTFIEYVEALRLSTSYSSFIENLKSVRYFDGIVDFKKRRHFFTDWNELKTVKNITAELTKDNVKTVIKKLNFIKELQPKVRVINYISSENIVKIAPKLLTGDYCGFYTSTEGLDVTHVGIIIVNENTIKLRHASSRKGYVLDEDFLEYSKEKEGIIVFRALEQ